LFDTLLTQVELPELLAILGHEIGTIYWLLVFDIHTCGLLIRMHIGHWKLWHTIQGFFITQIYIFSLFLVFSFVQNTPGLFSAFGFAYTEPMPVFVGKHINFISD
jgi:STE24 endopeptidase